VRRARFRRLAIPLILTGLTACDNVSWGGVRMRLETPPVPADTAAGAAEPAAVEAPPSEGPRPLQLGPLLFLVERDAEEATAFPVAEIGPGGLRDLPGPASVPDATDRIAEAAMAPGTELVLFAAGARVGTFHVREAAGVDTTYCRPRPRSRGRIELAPDAMPAQRFLAVPHAHAGDAPLAPYQPQFSTRDQRVAALNMAARLFPRLGARWPASILGARADLQRFSPSVARGPVIATTFLHHDQLGVGPPNSPQAWSLFFLAEDLGDGYEPTFVWFRLAEEEGKGIPRFVDHMDWDRDGSHEVLLEVVGAETRWFAAVSPEGPGWFRSHEEACPDTGPGSGVAAGG